MALQYTVHKMPGCHKRMLRSRKKMPGVYITQVIILVNDKKIFNESLNVSCNICHCQWFGLLSFGHPNGAQYFPHLTQTLSKSWFRFSTITLRPRLHYDATANLP